MKNIDSLFEPDGINCPVSTAIVIFYYFENAGAAESSHWLGVGMIVAHLRPHKGGAHIIFNVFGEAAKSV